MISKRSDEQKQGRERCRDPSQSCHDHSRRRGRASVAGDTSGALGSLLRSSGSAVSKSLARESTDRPRVRGVSKALLIARLPPESRKTGVSATWITCATLSTLSNPSMNDHLCRLARSALSKPFPKRQLAAEVLNRLTLRALSDCPPGLAADRGARSRARRLRCAGDSR